MPYGIVSFVPLKFLLCNGTIFFILVGVLCEFAMVLSVDILLSPQEEEVHSSSWGHRKYTFSSAFIKKNLCLPLYYYAKVIVELEKTQTRN